MKLSINNNMPIMNTARQMSKAGVELGKTFNAGAGLRGFMRNLLLLCVLLFSGCATPIYSDWECLNLWAELEIPRYRAYLEKDKTLSLFEVDERIKKANRIVEVTRDYIQIHKVDMRGDFVARD